jgi:prepilin-type N-terminal cleavage/methylation domain-containing protein
MKNHQATKHRSPSRRSGFTLVEMMMVVGIFLFVFVGVMVAVQLFGLRIYTLEATKLVATQGGRMALSDIRDQIREAKIVYVGNCSSVATNSFNLIAVTNVQEGNALIVYPTTNTAAYTVYYLDTSTGTNNLTQFNVTNGAVSYQTQLAQYITNQIVFEAQNWQGVVATNYTALDNREVIYMIMQFSQWEYPIAFVGGHDFNAFDFYQLRTKVFRRAWN